MGPVKKFYRKKAKASPTSARESCKKTPTGKDTTDLLTLFPPPASFSGNFRELQQSFREYLSKNFPKLAHLLDTGGTAYEKAKLLAAKKEKKLSQAQADVAKAKSRKALSESDSMREDASKLLQVVLGSLSADSVRKT